jgi:hypothetical protein
MRWIRFGSPGRARHASILLAPPVADPGVTDDERRTVNEMMAKGTHGGILLATEDLDGTFERVQASGAEAVQEPMAQDLWGSRLRVQGPRGQPGAHPGAAVNGPRAV